LQRDANLPLVGETCDLPRLGASAAERGKQNTDQQGDNSDNDEQLDERKSRRERPMSTGAIRRK